ncbi:MAG: DMT family transporter [Bdellovibrionales bacterium]|nr:DMT family transporter [Bdellovibrionales bacterium]
MSTVNDQSEKKTPTGVQPMIASVVLFTLGHAAVKWVPHIPFYQLVFLRAAITAIICIVYLKRQKISIKGNNLKLLFVRGLAGTCALLAYFYSLQHMPLASAVTLQYLSPILTIIVAYFLLNEKVTKFQSYCFALAFIGVLMVKGFDDRITLFELSVSLFSVVASAFAYNFVRMLRKTDHEMIVVLYFPLVTLPIVTPFALNDWVTPSLRDWMYILVIGVFTQIAQYLMTISYHRQKAADIAIYNYLGIIIAVAIGYYFFNEGFSLLSVAGMILIMSSLVLSGKKKKPALQ